MTTLTPTTESLKIFQLTSSRRGWLFFQISFRWSVYFNSHPHEEDDHMHKTVYCIRDISTHILTKRMTLGITLKNICNKFQLTSSRRGWQWYHVCVFIFIIFQLTSSRRGWPYFSSFVIITVPFQLTSSRRGWRYYDKSPGCLFIFQLTSSRRGWHGATVLIKGVSISTHILTKRMTVCWFYEHTIANISTHILTKRMTNGMGADAEYISFQLTSSRRGWRFKEMVNIHLENISTHILTKRMTFNILVTR